MQYQQLKEKMYELQLVSSMGALLSWDMEVNMPKNSDRNFRGDQSAYISGLHFQMFTDPKLVELVNNLYDNGNHLSIIEQKNVSKIKKSLDQTLKFTKEFVEKEARLTTEAHHIWADAKSKSDFKLYEKTLAEIVELLKEKAEIIGYENHKYNALLDLYEEGSNVKDLDILFGEVKLKLKPLIEKVVAKQNVTTKFMSQYFDKDTQMLFTKDILDFLNCDANLYHLGLATHPFCTHFHPTDIRMTTRIDENDLSSVVWSAIHEMGHGLYEMGLNKNEVGMPISESTSLGIHESQSRFWENNIGRNRQFIEAIFPIMLKHFPKQFEKATPTDIFNEVNYVKPSLIRTESDELTYHYHIMIRYEIEKMLIENSLQVKDVVSYWNESYKKFLDLDVPNDAKGALQDIHWSMGGMGYFPTYSQGSFYASQWYEAISKDHNVDQMIKNKEFSKIQKWHNDHIHVHGKLLNSNEICEKSTGNKLSFSSFENYIKQKFEI